MESILRREGFRPLRMEKVGDAIDYCLEHADDEDVIFVGGSTFTVASIPEEFFSGMV